MTTYFVRVGITRSIVFFVDSFDVLIPIVWDLRCFNLLQIIFPVSPGVFGVLEQLVNDNSPWYVKEITRHYTWCGRSTSDRCSLCKALFDWLAWVLGIIGTHFGSPYQIAFYRHVRVLTLHICSGIYIMTHHPKKILGIRDLFQLGGSVAHGSDAFA